MKIGIDANWAIYEQAGIGKYTYNLIKALLQTDTQNSYVLFANFIRHYKQRKRVLHELIANSTAEVKLKVQKFPSAWMESLTQTNLPAKWLYKEELDLYHSPFFAGIPQNGFEKMVITIHDLVFLKFPEHRGKKLSDYYLKRTKTALAKCQKVIAVSNSTKKDLVELLNVSPDKITVIPEAANKNFKVLSKTEVSQKTVKYMPSGTKYLLSVCTLEPRKNLTRLLYAYSMLPHELKKDYKLVLSGKKGWNNADFERTVVNLNLKNNLILTGYVADEDLPALYNGAAAFIYPSLYEGFGLPPLEAMACGVPVLTSNVSSLPEVVGHAGVLFDPKSEEEMATKIKKVLEDKTFHDSLSKRGLIQASKFSWERTAKETIKVYESLKSTNG